jgi:hypothetical protein
MCLLANVIKKGAAHNVQLQLAYRNCLEKYCWSHDLKAWGLSLSRQVQTEKMQLIESISSFGEALNNFPPSLFFAPEKKN